MSQTPDYIEEALSEFEEPLAYLEAHTGETERLHLKKILLEVRRKSARRVLDIYLEKFGQDADERFMGKVAAEFSY